MQLYLSDESGERGNRIKEKIDRIGEDAVQRKSTRTYESSAGGTRHTPTQEIRLGFRDNTGCTKDENTMAKLWADDSEIPIVM